MGSLYKSEHETFVSWNRNIIPDSIHWKYNLGTGTAMTTAMTNASISSPTYNITSRSSTQNPGRPIASHNILRTAM